MIRFFETLFTVFLLSIVIVIGILVMLKDQEAGRSIVLVWSAVIGSIGVVGYVMERMP